MKRHGTILVAALALCLAASAFATTAHAQQGDQGIRKADMGFSIGAQTGVATFDDFDATQFVWRVQAAYSPCKWVSGELEWLDLGAPNNKFPTLGKVEMAASGFNLSIVPTVPINDDLAVFAKLGGYFWDANFQGASGGNWSSDMTFGAGVSYKLFPTFGAGVKAEWTRVMLDVPTQSFSAGTLAAFGDAVDVFTVGAYFLF